MWTSNSAHWSCVASMYCPKDPGMSKKGIISTILFWGWDLDHQSYSREGSGFFGLYIPSIFTYFNKKVFHTFSKAQNIHFKSSAGYTWSIISVKFSCLGSPPFISHEVRPCGRGPTTPIRKGDLVTKVSMSWEPILQVGCISGLSLR